MPVTEAVVATLERDAMIEVARASPRPATPASTESSAAKGLLGVILRCVQSATPRCLGDAVVKCLGPEQPVLATSRPVLDSAQSELESPEQAAERARREEEEREEAIAEQELLAPDQSNEMTRNLSAALDTFWAEHRDVYLSDMITILRDAVMLSNSEITSETANSLIMWTLAAVYEKDAWHPRDLHTQYWQMEKTINNVVPLLCVIDEVGSRPAASSTAAFDTLQLPKASSVSQSTLAHSHLCGECSPYLIELAAGGRCEDILPCHRRPRGASLAQRYPTDASQ